MPELKVPWSLRWQAEGDYGRPQTRADVVGYDLPCGARAIFRAARPFALQVGREVLAWEQLGDIEVAITRIATLPDYRLAIREMRSLVAQMTAAPAAEQ